MAEHTLHSVAFPVLDDSQVGQADCLAAGSDDYPADPVGCQDSGLGDFPAAPDDSQADQAGSPDLVCNRVARDDCSQEVCYPDADSSAAHKDVRNRAGWPT